MGTLFTGLSARNVIDVGSEGAQRPEGRADQWFQMGHMIIRIHQQPRKHLFLPHEVQDLPRPLESLLPQRLTLVQHDGIHEVTPRQDDWQAHFDPVFVDREWIGCTVFHQQPHRRHKSQDVSLLQDLFDLELSDNLPAWSILKRAQLWPPPPGTESRVSSLVVEPSITPALAGLLVNQPQP